MTKAFAKKLFFKCRLAAKLALLLTCLVTRYFIDFSHSWTTRKFTVPDMRTRHTDSLCELKKRHLIPKSPNIFHFLCLNVRKFLWFVIVYSNKYVTVQKLRQNKKTVAVLDTLHVPSVSADVRPYVELF